MPGISKLTDQAKIWLRCFHQGWSWVHQRCWGAGELRICISLELTVVPTLMLYFWHKVFNFPCLGKLQIWNGKLFVNFGGPVVNDGPNVPKTFSCCRLGGQTFSLVLLLCTLFIRVARSWYWSGRCTIANVLQYVLPPALVVCDCTPRFGKNLLFSLCCCHYLCFMYSHACCVGCWVGVSEFGPKCKKSRKSKLVTSIPM